MHFPTALILTTLTLTPTLLAAPLRLTTLTTRQLAGEGAACNSVLSSTDNGVGYGVENAEDNTAATISSGKVTTGSGTAGSGSGSGGAPPAKPKPAPKGKPARRQLAGEGAACNSVLSSTDNGVGYGIENAEDNTAATASGTKTARQLDKVANGAQAMSAAAGTGDSTSAATTELDTLDGTSTSGAANAGAQIGSTEESTLEGIGNAVPRAVLRRFHAVRRQGDKIANGAQAIGEAAGVGDETAPATTAGDELDSTSTSGAANAGAMVGSEEESTLEGAGNMVPRL